MVFKSSNLLCLQARMSRLRSSDCNESDSLSVTEWSRLKEDLRDLLLSKGTEKVKDLG